MDFTKTNTNFNIQIDEKTNTATIDKNIQNWCSDIKVRKDFILEINDFIDQSDYIHFIIKNIRFSESDIRLDINAEKEITLENTNIVKSIGKKVIKLTTDRSEIDTIDISQEIISNNSYDSNDSTNISKINKLILNSNSNAKIENTIIEELTLKVNIKNRKNTIFSTFLTFDFLFGHFKSYSFIKTSWSIFMLSILMISSSILFSSLEDQGLLNSLISFLTKFSFSILGLSVFITGVLKLGQPFLPTLEEIKINSCYYNFLISISNLLQSIVILSIFTSFYLCQSIYFKNSFNINFINLIPLLIAMNLNFIFCVKYFKYKILDLIFEINKLALVFDLIFLISWLLLKYDSNILVLLKIFTLNLFIILISGSITFKANNHKVFIFNNSFITKINVFLISTNDKLTIFNNFYSINYYYLNIEKIAQLFFYWNNNPIDNEELTLIVQKNKPYTALITLLKNENFYLSNNFYNILIKKYSFSKDTTNFFKLLNKRNSLFLNGTYISYIKHELINIKNFIPITLKYGYFNLSLPVTIIFVMCIFGSFSFFQPKNMIISDNYIYSNLSLNKYEYYCTSHECFEMSYLTEGEINIPKNQTDYKTKINFIFELFTPKEFGLVVPHNYCQDIKNCKSIHYQVPAIIRIPIFYGEYNKFLYTLGLFIPVENSQRKLFQPNNDIIEYIEFLYKIFGYLLWIMILSKAAKFIGKSEETEDKEEA